MTRLTALLPLVSLLLAFPALAVPCVQFDTAFNLYAFGGSSDVNLGASSSWASPSPKTLTTTGRPPWTGSNSQCLLSQYNNAMYVLGGDASDLSKIYIFNFAASSWSVQSTTSAPSSLTSRSSSVLDHDTNVLFTLSGNVLYQLDLSSVTTTASGSAIAWVVVNNPSFATTGYTPTAAQASNHISFFGVPGTAAGSANEFVVHYSYFQPTAQAFPTQNGGATFPDTAGQAVSIPDAADNVPYQMVFVPNDFSSTYIVTHWTNPSNYADLTGAPFATSLINTTQVLPAPSSKDANAAYAASPSAIVQIDTSGNIYYLNNPINNFAVQSGASWTKLAYTASGGTASNSTSGASGSSSASASASATSSGSASASASASSTGSASRMSSSGAAAASSASGTSSASAAAATTSKSAAGRVDGKDVVGLALGVMAIAAGAML